MAELNFATGVVTFTVNGKCDISFNPTDSAFVERLFNAFDTLDKKQEAYKTEISKVGDNREIFNIARRRDDEMRELIDGVFERPVCKDLFGGMNVYAMADGLPVWCNFLLTVMDEVDTTFAREQMLGDSVTVPNAWGGTTTGNLTKMEIKLSNTVAANCEVLGV